MSDALSCDLCHKTERGERGPYRVYDGRYEKHQTFPIIVHMGIMVYGSRGYRPASDICGECRKGVMKQLAADGFLYQHGSHLPREIAAALGIKASA